MMGRKLKKNNLVRGRGRESKSASEGSHLPPYFGLGGGGGSMSASGVRPGPDSAGTPATLTSYLNNDLNFFKICSPVSKD